MMNSGQPPPGIPPETYWLSNEDYQKVVGHLSFDIQKVLGVFDCYGQGIFIRQATAEITRIAENFGLRVRGIDKIITIEEGRWRPVP